MAGVDAKRAEVEANYAAFEAALPALLPHCEGKFAALRNRKVIEVFDNYAVALDYCARSFPDHVFSIQRVEAEPLQFGSVTHAANSSLV